MIVWLDPLRYLTSDMTHINVYGTRNDRLLRRVKLTILMPHIACISKCGVWLAVIFNQAATSQVVIYGFDEAGAFDTSNQLCGVPQFFTCVLLPATALACIMTGHVLDPALVISGRGMLVRVEFSKNDAVRINHFAGSGMLAVDCLALSPDNNIFACGVRKTEAEGVTCGVYGYRHWIRDFALKSLTPVDACALGGNRRIAVASGLGVFVYDISDHFGRPLARVARVVLDRPVSSCAFSSRGLLACVTTSGAVRIYDRTLSLVDVDRTTVRGARTTCAFPFDISDADTLVTADSHAVMRHSLPHKLLVLSMVTRVMPDIARFMS
jgi:hypothetical protein